MTVTTRLTDTAEHTDTREAGTHEAGTHEAGTREAAPRRAAYVPEVDALRGIAMTAVVLFHCKLLPFGWMGVWLFYVVSGFSVTMSLFSRAHPASGPAAAMGGFYLRRALRIWPLYFAFIALNVVVLAWLGITAPLQDLPWLLSFTQNLKMILFDYPPGAAWPAFGHLWTLAVEQQFYLAFPLLLLINSRRARGVALLAVILIAPAFRAAVAHWAVARGWGPEQVAFTVYAFGPTHFDAFAIGSLIALFRDVIARDRRLFRAMLALAATVTLIHIATYATVNSLAAGRFSVEAMRNIVSGILYGQGREITVYLLPSLATGAMLMGILSGERTCLRLCRLPGLQGIGRVSYAGYLFHIPILMLLAAFVPVFTPPPGGARWVIGHIGLFVCAYTLTVTTAWLSFTYFEQYFTRLRRR